MRINLGEVTFTWEDPTELAKNFLHLDSDDRKKPGVIGKEDQRVDKKVKDTVDLNISHVDGWKTEDVIFFTALGKALE